MPRHAPNPFGRCVDMHRHAPAKKRHASLFGRCMSVHAEQRFGRSGDLLVSRFQDSIFRGSYCHQNARICQEFAGWAKSTLWSEPSISQFPDFKVLYFTGAIATPMRLFIKISLTRLKSCYGANYRFPFSRFQGSIPHGSCCHPNALIYEDFAGWAKNTLWTDLSIFRFRGFRIRHFEGDIVTQMHLFICDQKWPTLPVSVFRILWVFSRASPDTL
jgi:hypothetical protein